MRKGLIFIILVFSISILFGIEKDRLAVMDVQDTEEIFGSTIRAKVTDYIFTKMQTTNIYWMIPKSDRDSALEQAIDETKQDSRKECVDEKCQLSLVAELQANFLINTEIKRLFENTCQISIKKFDVEKRAGTEAWQSKFDCTEKGIYEAIDSLNFGGKKKGSSFQEGKIGEAVEDWEVGQGEETIVEFSSEPIGAVVMIDGVMKCQKTPCSKMITQGKHEISMQLENYVSKVQMNEIKKGAKISFMLEPDYGWLTVSGNHKVKLKLDGEAIGTIPVSKRVINPGAHQIEHADSCYYQSGEKFTIKRGETKEIYVELDPKISAIKVTAQDMLGNDVEATVLVDGKEVGTAPGTFKIPMCSKQLVLESKSGKYRQNLTLKEKEISEISAQMISNSEYKTQKTRPYVGVGVGFLVTGVLSFGAAGLSHYLMTTYNDDARAKFNPEDTSKSKEFVDKAKSAGMARNVLIGIGAGFSTLGIIMFFITKEQPVAVYVDEKGFMLSYNFKF